jgi:hypothetical protein
MGHLMGFLVVDLGTEDIPLKVSRMFIMNEVNRLMGIRLIQLRTSGVMGKNCKGLTNFLLAFNTMHGEDADFFCNFVPRHLQQKRKNKKRFIFYWKDHFTSTHYQLQRNPNEYTKASLKLETTDAAETMQNKIVNALLQMKWILSQHRNERNVSKVPTFKKEKETLSTQNSYVSPH